MSPRIETSLENSEIENQNNSKEDIENDNQGTKTATANKTTKNFTPK